MSEVGKHTPGPWTAKHMGGSNFAVQMFDIRAQFGNKPHVYPIFNRDTSSINGTTVNISPGDAALIAAGPDLLEAMKGIEHFSDAVAYRTDPLAVALRQWIDAGKAAIAKAEGR